MSPTKTDDLLCGACAEAAFADVLRYHRLALSEAGSERLDEVFFEEISTRCDGCGAWLIEPLGDESEGAAPLVGDALALASPGWSTSDERFDELLRGWMQSAAVEFGYSMPHDGDLAKVLDRLPLGVRALIVDAYDAGLLLPVGGYQFSLAGLGIGKGPYAWVGRSTSTQVPAVHWEYLVQAAEYARIYSTLTPKGYVVAVEDRLMDVTVSSEAGDLLWYLEVKEQAADLPAFSRRIAQYGVDGIRLDADDRGNDALRKAKYLMLYRPSYFSISAIGMRLDYRVTYTPTGYTLTEDMVPLA